MKKHVQSIQGYLRDIVGWLKKHLGRENENATFYILIIFMLLVCVFGLNIFLDLAEALREEQLGTYDNEIQQWIFGFRDPALTPTVAFITDLGDRYAYFVVVGIMSAFLLFKKRYWLVGQVFFVGLISALATIALKHTYNRQRPAIEHLVEIGGLSFPSGHSLSAMAFYGFVIYLIVRFARSRTLKIMLSVLCILLILAIGLSRIYLGVHYPSDVAAGFAGGLIWASFCIILFNLIELWRKRSTRKRMDDDAAKNREAQA